MKKVVKKEVRKPEPVKVPVKKEVKKIKIIEPLRVETIKDKYPSFQSEKKEMTMPTKYKVLTIVPLPENYVRCIVLIDHTGMLENHDIGDIVDLPDRRYKTLANRGVVEIYDGEDQPNKRR